MPFFPPCRKALKMHGSAASHFKVVVARLYHKVVVARLYHRSDSWHCSFPWGRDIQSLATHTCLDEIASPCLLPSFYLSASGPACLHLLIGLASAKKFMPAGRGSRRKNPQYNLACCLTSFNQGAGLQEGKLLGWWTVLTSTRSLILSSVWPLMSDRLLSQL